MQLLIIINMPLNPCMTLSYSTPFFFCENEIEKSFTSNRTSFCAMLISWYTVRSFTIMMFSYLFRLRGYRSKPLCRIFLWSDRCENDLIRAAYVDIVEADVVIVCWCWTLKQQTKSLVEELQPSNIHSTVAVQNISWTFLQHFVHISQLL